MSDGGLERDACSRNFMTSFAARIARLERMSFQDRQHFFATGARIFGQAMVDEIRKKRSAKRRAPTVAIQDFVSADDIVVLDNAVFTGLAAADASDRIIYSSTTGAPLFDLDGLGGVAVQFATLSGHPAITAADLS
jgi:hypothetical protein